MLTLVSEHFTLAKVHDYKNKTSRKYRIDAESKGVFGLISTMSNSFCAGCNRIRITSDGKMKNCLFGADEFDLLKSFRNNESLTELIKLGIIKKHKEKGGQFSEMENVNNQKIINRSMIKIGG